MTALAALALAVSCAPADPAGEGARLFRSRALSSARSNSFTCATCHATTLGDTGVTRPGASLAGVTRRTSFWGGMEGDLLEAVNDCRRYFMSDRTALLPGDDAARALYAYLQTLDPGDDAPVPFTVVQTIADVGRGESDHGAAAYARTCRDCHGDRDTGTDRLSGTIPVLPEDVLASHAAYDDQTQRLIFIEKVRHGGFFGYTGVMPPFSVEALPDDELGDLLETLQVRGGAVSAGQALEHELGVLPLQRL